MSEKDKDGQMNIGKFYILHLHKNEGKYWRDRHHGERLTDEQRERERGR